MHSCGTGSGQRTSANRCGPMEKPTVRRKTLITLSSDMCYIKGGRLDAWLKHGFSDFTVDE
jgi:hypothetical protein